MRNKLLIIITLVIIFILSVMMGFFLAGNNKNNNEEPTPLPEAVPTIPSDVANNTDEVFKIQLTGTTLEMFEGEEIIKSAEISPEIYPVMDIRALESGTEYTSYEQALMDWESISE